MFMSLHNSLSDKYKLYTRYLEKITDIRFTIREIDVIACIIHNRGIQNISGLLSISARTVGAHIYNIRAKLGYIPKDSIIDIIEKSGKLQYIQQYYLHLVAQSLFEKYLCKIAAVVNRTEIICNADYNNMNEQTKKLLSQLKYFLKLANITLTENKDTSGCMYNICVIDAPSTLENNHNLDTKEFNIALLLDENVDKSTLVNLEYIDFINDHYSAILSLIAKIINKPELLQLTKKFKNEYQTLQSSWNGSKVQNIASENNTTSFRVTKKLKLAVAAIAICLIVTLSVFLLPKTQPNIVKLNEQLADFAMHFSSDNISTQAKRKENYRLLSEVEKIAPLFDNQQVYTYFSSKEVPTYELMNCLYVLHALANQYTNYQHNYKKARKLLEHIKIFAEQYVINKSSVGINFNELSKEEIYLELNIIQDLPEIYTRIIYLLGRTYIYQGNVESSVQYFKLASYLGSKLKTFEGYLSQRSGLEVIRRQEIDNDIENGDFAQAVKKLHAAIKSMSELREDNTAYKINYHPGHTNQTIVPKNDSYSRVYCTEQIVKYYARLVMITSDARQNEKYTNKISSFFIGNKSLSDLMDFAEKNIPQRSAAVYISLGNTLLKLYEKHLSFATLKTAMSQKLKITPKTDLDFIEKLFKLAASKSRNTHYTKADSYDGLARVYEIKLQQEEINVEQKLMLQNAIKDLRLKRDNINQKLTRMNQELRQHNL
ncbi:MAG: hypothetical protein COA94_08590 [Rickettsiales bacterium]|nr:MAG: hypothetical protein COA94_08590 [Rickettsiales bacterium]